MRIKKGNPFEVKLYIGEQVVHLEKPMLVMETRSSLDFLPLLQGHREATSRSMTRLADEVIRGLAFQPDAYVSYPDNRTVTDHTLLMAIEAGARVCREDFSADEIREHVETLATQLADYVPVEGGRAVGIRTIPGRCRRV